MKPGDILREFYRLKIGQGFSRSAEELEGLFLLLVFAEFYGLPNPLGLYLLEAYPLLMEEFHRWHLRMGMRSSPLEWIRCC